MKKPKIYKPKRAATKTFVRHTTASKGYDNKWRVYSYRFLHHNPLCYVCGEKAKVVDHIVPAKVNREVYFWKIDNYLPMCVSCHNTVTALFDRGAVPNTLDKLKFIAQKREERGISIKVRGVPFKN